MYSYLAKMLSFLTNMVTFGSGLCVTFCIANIFEKYPNVFDATLFEPYRHSDMSGVMNDAELGNVEKYLTVGVVCGGNLFVNSSVRFIGLLKYVYEQYDEYTQGLMNSQSEEILGVQVQHENEYVEVNESDNMSKEDKVDEHDKPKVE